MKLTNPTQNHIVVSIFGTEYSLEAGKTISVPEPVGVYWKTKLHEFLLVEPDGDEVKDGSAIPKKVAEVAEDKKEEEPEEKKEAKKTK